MEKITFNAYLPPIQSAISFGQDAVRVKLEIPASDRDQAKKLVDLTDMPLKITVESDNG